MSLAAEANLGPYEIVSALGAGGMGEVTGLTCRIAAPKRFPFDTIQHSDA